MGIKTIPLSRLEADPGGTLSECADSGQALVVELPGDRFVAIHPLEPGVDDSLMDELRIPFCWKFSLTRALGPRSCYERSSGADTTGDREKRNQTRS